MTDEGFVARGQRPGGPYVASFQRGAAVLRRRGGLPPVHLRPVSRYLVEETGGRGAWQARTVEWIYVVADAAGNRIAAFHWHPVDSGRVTWPHLHAYGQHASVELHKLHLPTGPVSIASVVRFLIADLDVVPRRANWAQILERHEQALQWTST